MKVTANDVSSDHTFHTFQVKFTDVCGNTKTADYKYTQKVRGCMAVPVAVAVCRVLPSGLACGQRFASVASI